MAYANLDVGLIAEPELTQDQTSSIAAGQTVYLGHRYTAASTGSVSFSIADFVQNPAGAFSSSLFLDAGCDGTLDNVLAGPQAVVEGQAICVAVRTQSGSGVGAGASLTYGLVALTAFMGIMASHVRNDDRLGSNGGAELVFHKHVRNLTTGTSEAKSNSGDIGDTLEYRISFHNPAPSRRRTSW